MMVRINLLPGKRRSGVGSALGRLVAVMVVMLIAELGFLYFAYDGKAGEVKKRADQLRIAQADVQKIQSGIAGLPNVQGRAVELEQRERALAELAAIRIGPQHMMDEMKRILARPKTRASIKQAKDAGWNVAWEAENVYLEEFAEETEGRVVIRGYARSLDDVAEYWLRLRSSKLFQSVRLASITEHKNSQAGVDLQKFQFSTMVNFYYQTKEGVALMEQIEQSRTDETEPQPTTEQ
ncbi:MAG: hypothetical protein CO108_22670 [Deltaproteobacteria bacterium CG_4_9_14_3_um_filter_63_12]|nr:MAG: hypothetical protein CO108_22670 [Deltaproteobacteria bacterium CG_4_9_14_3_um_filter_63_12]